MKKVAFGIESLEERIAPWPLGLDAFIGAAANANAGNDCDNGTNGSHSDGNGSTGTHSNGSNSDHS